MFATWISRQLFSIFDEDRVFEEMDKLELESKILEHEEDVPTTPPWILVAGITVATATVTCAVRRAVPGGFWVFGGITVAGTVAVGTVGARWWLRRRARVVRRITVDMERARAALRKRRQVYFSLQMRPPTHRNPLIHRACRLAVTAIETLATETTVINGTSWTDLYTDEIRGITARSSRNPEKLAIEEGEETQTVMEEHDFEAVFETLIAVFKLHASEYSRVVICDFLRNFQFWKCRRFLTTCGELSDIGKKIGAIESLALHNSRESTDDRRDAEKREKTLEIGWKQQTIIAMEAVLDGLKNQSISRNEVETALRRTLVIIGTESALKSDQPEGNSMKIDRKLVDSQQEASGDAVPFVHGERTDVDMVFEGTPLSEADKLASRSACARDVLLDGSESRKHEASLMGELNMVLEPRRTDFAKRERKALAKFYGVEEEKLEQEEEEETSTGTGIGGNGDNPPEPYDWRQDAENSLGLHQEADNIDFLSALASRRVMDDVIE